jgi:hypothetical protein
MSAATIQTTPLLALLEMPSECEIITRSNRRKSVSQKELRSQEHFARRAAADLAHDYREREVQLAMKNLRQCGSSSLSSPETIIEANARLTEQAT